MKQGLRQEIFFTSSKNKKKINNAFHKVKEKKFKIKEKIAVNGVQNWPLLFTFQSRSLSSA